LSSKNADYGKALEYLMFQHNERTQQPILDSNGNMMLRDEYYLDGLNCQPFSFDAECEQTNAAYHKNQGYNEIKSHHYILSFDPRDAEESGLTGEKAQSIGLEFAKRYLPGHQALVCTHMDGHNGSGNIHVHIVINSVRKLDVEPQGFMERPCDSRAGYKHHQTRDYLTAMQRGIMDIAEREHLHQVDLLSPAPVKVTESEYWKNRREQEKLDKLNQEIIADGMTPRKTTYQTQKQFLRDAISEVSAYACSLEEFKNALAEKYDISMKESRGRFSYLHPERQKYITGRKLGSHFEKDYLLGLLAENARSAKSAEAEIPQESSAAAMNNTAPASTNRLSEYDPNYDYQADPITILFIRSNLRLVVDLQTNIKAQQNAAYARKVKISNLKEMARTVCYIQEHGYDTRDDLAVRLNDVSAKLSEARKTLRATQDRIKELNEQIHFVGQYQAHKSVQSRFLKAQNKKKYRQEHRSELELYDAGVSYIKNHFAGKVPSLKALKAEHDQLLQMKDAQSGTYQYFKDYQKELRTASTNVDAILGIDRSRTQDREKAQDIS
ncbi:MAG: relaxase/mobilization nuclease domain-containing protein, partial [Butyrivibrio sp.]|nr:relaxase/mobilization nuclease domain-containing protein [Butyrivibrio sp.]